MNIRTVLFPTDLSDDAHVALQDAALLAKAFDARLVLFHAAKLDMSEILDPTDAGTPPTDKQRELEVEAKAQLEALAARLDPRPARVDTVVHGDNSPTEAILGAADRYAADCIALSSHGRTGFRRLMLGSKAEEVARRAACPVLVVRRDPDLEHPAGLRRILAAVDLSSATTPTLEVAASVAEQIVAPLEVLHVVAPPPPVVGAPDGSAPVTPLRAAPPDFDELRTDAETRLKSELRNADGREATIRITHGNAAEEILRAAEDTEASLLVLGSTGQSKIGRLLLGSVCDEVMRKAPCPVLVVPAPDERESVKSA